MVVTRRKSCCVHVQSFTSLAQAPPHSSLTLGCLRDVFYLDLWGLIPGLENVWLEGLKFNKYHIGCYMEWFMGFSDTNKKINYRIRQ
jgi:hypothetical protein